MIEHSYDQDQNVLSVRLTEDLTVRGYRQFYEAFQYPLSKGALIDMDVGECGAIDWAGMGMMMAMKDRLNDRYARWVIRNANQSLSQFCQMVGLERHFEFE